MSAVIEEVTTYSATCDECRDAFEHESEDRALEWASNHDAENHTDPCATDDDYDAFKESRYDVL